MIVRTLEQDHPHLTDKPTLIVGGAKQEVDAQHFVYIEAHVSFMSLHHLGEADRKRRIELAAMQGRYGDAVRLWHESPAVQQFEYAPRTESEIEMEGGLPYDLSSDSSRGDSSRGDSSRGDSSRGDADDGDRSGAGPSAGDDDRPLPF
jgi:hypothetical protein